MNWWILLLLRAIAQDSVPEFGSFARYRAAPRDSLLSIVPVDGAEFIRNQRFDVSVEFHALGFDPPSMEELKITINGETAEKALGKPVEAVETWNFTYAKTLKALDRKEFTSVAVSRVAIRSGKLQRPGRYTVKVSVAGHNLEAEWIVRKPSKRSVKNVILMIGDGMASSMISAARMISKPTKFGKFQDNVLNLEKLGGSIGKIITNGIDSIMTDSANSAASYNSGHKGWSSSLNVYADTSESPLDDPKVETIAEYIRSYRPQMCIGIVTTAEIQDATPAAVYSHTRSRYDKDKITDQALNGFTNMNISWDPLPVKSDVLFGGGGSYFCNDHPGCKSFNKRDFYQEFKELGYSVVNNKEDLEFQKGDKPILGIFNSRTMDTWIDRNIYPKSQNKNGDPQGETKQALNQPGLEEMAIKAIEILEARCSDGFYLMIEAASIDKAMHVLDYDRGLGELLELDRTVKLVNDWRIDNIQNFDTALIVTSDHAQAYDVVGVVDTEYLSELPEHDNIFGVELKGKQNDLQYFKRRALGIYEYAGWPDLVTDSTGLPNNWEGRYRLWGGKVDNLQHREDFKLKKKYREPIVEDTTLSNAFNGTIYVMNPAETGLYYSPSTYPDWPTTEHSLQSVDLYCVGPQVFMSRCTKVMDNTELFFIMADALGLGGDDGLYLRYEDFHQFPYTVTVQKIETKTVYLPAPTPPVKGVYKRSYSSATRLCLKFWKLMLLAFA